MTAAILNVLKLIPASTAVKALSKVDKRFKNYFASAAAYGLDVNRAVDFVSDRFSQDNEEGRIQKKPAPTLEEKTALQNIQTSQRIPRNLKTAASFAAGGLLGETPEEATPEQQAAQALSPQQQLAQRAGQAAAPVTQAYKAQQGMATPVIAGRAIAQAQQAPHRLQAALKAKNGPQTALQAPQATQAAPTAFDMLKQNSPEIGAFMQAEMKKGKSPYEAAASARKKSDLKDPIVQLEAMAQMPFEGVIAHIFGGNVPQEQEITPTQNVPAQSTEYLQAMNKLNGLLQGYNQQFGK